MNDWPLRPIKSLVFWMARGAHPEYAEKTGFFVVNQGAISSYALEAARMRECKPLSGHKGRFLKGDLLIASTGEGVLGKCALAPNGGYGDSHTSIVRCKTAADAEFLFWWVAGHYDTINSLFALGATKQTELQKAAFLSHPIRMPPPAMRERISKFLRDECAILDRRCEALAKKKELLRELKSSVREEWTFGGSARGQKRASPVEWHGVIPAAWGVERLGNLFVEASEFGHGHLPVLSVSIHSGISDKELGDEELDRKVNRSEDRSIYKRVLPGDVVYNQMRAWQGGFGVARVEGLVSPAYVVARPRKNVSPEFVEHMLRTPRAIEEMRRRSRGITDFRLRLYWDEFKDIVIPYPPRSDQVTIAAEVDARLEIVDGEIKVIDELIEALGKQRESLVFDAVNGKIGPGSGSNTAAVAVALES